MTAPDRRLRSCSSSGRRLLVAPAMSGWLPSCCVSAAGAGRDLDHLAGDVRLANLVVGEGQVVDELLAFSVAFRIATMRARLLAGLALEDGLEEARRDVARQELRAGRRRGSGSKMNWLPGMPCRRRRSARWAAASPGAAAATSVEMKRAWMMSTRPTCRPGTRRRRAGRAAGRRRRSAGRRSR